MITLQNSYISQEYEFFKLCIFKVNLLLDFDNQTFTQYIFLL